MEITDLLGIGIVGTALSVALEGIKIKFGPTSYATKLLALLLSFFVGGIYVTLRETELWLTVVGILAASSTVYAFLFK